MGYRTTFLLALLWCMLLGSALGQRGDYDVASELEELKAKLEGLKGVVGKLNKTEKKLKQQVDKLKKENEEIKDRLNGTEMELEKVKDSCNVGPKVAFSASLVKSGEIYKGPCTDRTLVYTRVFSNTGNAYNQNTGVFTAPVKGLFYFTFSTMGYNTHLTGAILMKNGISQVSTYDDRSDDTTDSGTNAIVLQLDVGDRVSVELWENSRVFDNLNGHTTFSGFLLFPIVN